MTPDLGVRGKIKSRPEDRQWLFHNMTKKERQHRTGCAKEETVTWGLQRTMNVLEFSSQSELSSLVISLS